jgi:hypothetical protein
VYIDENDISAEKTDEIERTWIPQTHAHIIRARCPEKAQTEGKEAADRLKTADLVVFLLIGLNGRSGQSDRERAPS